MTTINNKPNNTDPSWTNDWQQILDRNLEKSTAVVIAATTLHLEAAKLYQEDCWKNEHNEFTRECWQNEAYNGDTQLGYWEWLSDELHEQDATSENHD